MRQFWVTLCYQTAPDAKSSLEVHLYKFLEANRFGCTKQFSAALMSLSLQSLKQTSADSSQSQRNTYMKGTGAAMVVYSRSASHGQSVPLRDGIPDLGSLDSMWLGSDWVSHVSVAQPYLMRGDFIADTVQTLHSSIPVAANANESVASHHLLLLHAFVSWEPAFLPCLPARRPRRHAHVSCHWS